MFHHFTILIPTSWLQQALVNLSTFGRYGVDCFFVLSGYLITTILLESKGHARYFQNFYMRRILRIFPLYYLVVIACLLVVPTLATALSIDPAKVNRLQAATAQWPWYLAYGSNFLIARQDAFHHGILDISWSLAIEEQFYVIWPLVVLCLSRRALQRLTLGLMGLAFLCRLLLWAFGGTPIQLYVLTFCRMDTIAFGAYLATRLQAGPTDPSRLLRDAVKGFWAIGGALAILYLAGEFVYHSLVLNTIGFTLLGLFFLLLLVIALQAPPSHVAHRLLTYPPLRFLGKYSYALYLCHLPTRSLIRDLWVGHPPFHQWPGGPLLWQGLFYLVATGVSIALALLSWHLIEKRALALKALFRDAPSESPVTWGTPSLARR